MTGMHLSVFLGIVLIGIIVIVMGAPRDGPW